MQESPSPTLSVVFVQVLGLPPNSSFAVRVQPGLEGVNGYLEFGGA